MMFYEEKHGGQWLRLDIDGEMLTGAAHHVIYFRSAEGWKACPGWARHRRDEIIARIKSRFHAPEYEYHEDERPASAYLATPVAAPVPSKKDGSILMPVAALLLIAAGAFWLAFDGVKDGEVRSMAKHQHSRKLTHRGHRPVLDNHFRPRRGGRGLHGLRLLDRGDERARKQVSD